MTTGSADQGSRFLDAQLHLLDRQVLDVAGVPVAVVDDLELSDVPASGEHYSADPCSALGSSAGAHRSRGDTVRPGPPSARWVS